MNFEDAVFHWAKVITFDAIIGNSDRNHDNWGIVWKGNEEYDPTYETVRGSLRASFCPAFDNGSALTHEIWEDHLDKKFGNDTCFFNYIERGRYHMKWNLKEERRSGHINLIK